eukprot:Platyproteum_vivax@DN4678_c0_g1_i1.p1
MVNKSASTTISPQSSSQSLSSKDNIRPGATKVTSRDDICEKASTKKERTTSDVDQSENFKINLCRFWMEANCRYGEACRFAHGLCEIQHDIRNDKQSHEGKPNESVEKVHPKVDPSNKQFILELIDLAKGLSLKEDKKEKPVMYENEYKYLANEFRFLMPEGVHALEEEKGASTKSADAIKLCDMSEENILLSVEWLSKRVQHRDVVSEEEALARNKRKEVEKPAKDEGGNRSTRDGVKSPKTREGVKSPKLNKREVSSKGETVEKLDSDSGGKVEAKVIPEPRTIPKCPEINAFKGLAANSHDAVFASSPLPPYSENIPHFSPYYPHSQMKDGFKYCNNQMWAADATGPLMSDPVFANRDCVPARSRDIRWGRSNMGCTEGLDKVVKTSGALHNLPPLPLKQMWLNDITNKNANRLPTGGQSILGPAPNMSPDTWGNNPRVRPLQSPALLGMKTSAINSGNSCVPPGLGVTQSTAYDYNVPNKSRIMSGNVISPDGECQPVSPRVYSTNKSNEDAFSAAVFSSDRMSTETKYQQKYNVAEIGAKMKARNYKAVDYRDSLGLLSPPPLRVAETATVLKPKLPPGLVEESYPYTVEATMDKLATKLQMKTSHSRGAKQAALAFQVSSQLVAEELSFKAQIAGTNYGHACNLQEKLFAARIYEKRAAQAAAAYMAEAQATELHRLEMQRMKDAYESEAKAAAQYQILVKQEVLHQENQYAQELEAQELKEIQEEGYMWATHN